jgi:hypothetical protein
MKIFREGDRIRFQLMDMQKGIMLFDFTIEKEAYPILKEHIIEYLEAFKDE